MRLHKYLYGLQHSPRPWFTRLASLLQEMGIVSSKADASLFIYIEGSLIMYVHVHVDDILVSGNSSYTVASLNHDLGSAFAIKDLGPRHYFLGMEVSELGSGLHLS